jgi:GNAT superfamily N-acetyltransferase
MEFVDRLLARRLEAAEEIPQVCHALHSRRLHPESQAGVEEIAGGSLSFVEEGSPIGRAVGLGLNGPVSRDEVERIEEFYRSRGGPAQVDVCPYTDLGFIEMLKTRGYLMTELNNVLYRKLSSDLEQKTIASGFRVEPGSPEKAEVFADIVCHSFFREGDIPPKMKGWLVALFQFPGAMTFLATVDGHAVGSSAGQIIAERNMIALFGDGTLPEYRGRGIQTATIHARLCHAAAAGCDLAVVVTQGGSSSQRNYERAGFRVAYSKATMVKEW